MSSIFARRRRPARARTNARSRGTTGERTIGPTCICPAKCAIDGTSTNSFRSRTRATWCRRIIRPRISARATAVHRPNERPGALIESGEKLPRPLPVRRGARRPSRYWRSPRGPTRTPARVPEAPSPLRAAWSPLRSRTVCRSPDATTPCTWWRLCRGARDDAEYSSMTRALLRRVTPWRPAWEPPAAVLLDGLLADAREGRTMQLDSRSAAAIYRRALRSSTSASTTIPAAATRPARRSALHERLDAPGAIVVGLRVARRDLDALLARRAGGHGGEPALQVRQPVDRDAGPVVDATPGPGRDIGDRVVAAQPGRFSEAALEDLEQAAALVLVALDRRLELLGEVAKKRWA